MRAWSLVFLLLILLPGMARSQDEMSLDYLLVTKAVSGFASLPFHSIEGVVANPSWTQAARAQPDSTADIVMILRSPKDLSRTIWGYEAEGTPVYARSDQWLEIQTAKGRAWIPAHTPVLFAPISSLIHRMTYLNDEWNGALYKSPSLSAPSFSIGAKYYDESSTEELMVEIHKWKNVDGRAWLLVTLPKELPCGLGPQLKKEFKGWIPAYNNHDRLVFWFYTSGC